MVGELAIALVFLTGAGLVAKTFWRATSVDPGFQPKNVLAASFALGNRYTSATAKTFFDELIARVRRAPGAQSAAYTQGAPMTGGGGADFRVGRPTGGPPLEFRGANVDPEYFETIGATLVTGRFIGPEDRAGAARVAVVTEEFVRVALEGAPAIGQKMRIPVGGELPRDATRVVDGMIVGVVKDIMQEPTDGKRLPLVFFPRAQQPVRPFLSMVVRTTGQPEALEARIRETVKGTRSAAAGT